MKKVLLTSLKVVAILIALFIALGTFLSIVLGGKIKDLAITEINKQLATEVTVKGAVTLSLFSNFPFASLQFNEVVIKESLPEKNDLLSCKKISLLFNVWDLMGSSYKVVKTVVSDGELNVHITADGKKNYDILKESSSSGPSDFSLQIEEAILSNILIRYTDDRSNHQYVFQTNHSTLSGNFSSSKFLLDIQSDLLCRQLVIDGIDYLPGRKAAVDCQLNVDLDKNLYTFTNGMVTIEGNQFGVSGSVLSLDEGSQLDLHISGKELRIEEIAALLPASWANYFSHFNSKGNFQFALDIKGNETSTETSQVTCQFGMTNGTIGHDDMKASFERVNMNGVYSNGAQKNLASSTIELKNFSTVFDGNPVNGYIMVRNFRTPYLNVKLDGTLSLRNLTPLFTTDFVKELEGIVNFQQFYFEGSANQLSTSLNFNKIKASGKFQLNDVKLVTAQASYDHISGSFNISDNQISFPQLSFNAEQSDLHFEGTINNFIPYLLSSWNDSTRNDQKIGLNVTLAAHQLKWEDLVGSGRSTAVDTSSDSYYSIPSIFYILQGNVTGSVDQFTYKKFNAANIHGNVVFPGQIIFFNDVGMNSENGTILVNGKLDISDANHSHLDMTSSLNHIDITQLFYEFDNFDQHTLTDKNLKGFITSNIALQATWNEKRFDPAQLHALADVTIDNGELNNFDPMLALARFVKMDELRNIRFSKLQNQIEIKNRTINIPTTNIYTNAVNVQLSGTHTFDNIIDYKVQLNLLKLLTTKFRKSTFDPAATDVSTEGFLNLYLTMSGPAANPVIKYDKQKVKEEIAQDLREEKSNLKDALNKEFDKQEQNQQQVKDWKAPTDIQYMQFEDSSDAKDEAKNSSEESVTKQNQQKAFDNFKNSLKPKTPPKEK